MARHTRGSSAPLLPPDKVLSVERARFLAAVDRVAPHVWPGLVEEARQVWNVAGERDGRPVLLHEHAAGVWAARHHLGVPWVVAMAIERLNLLRSSAPGERGASALRCTDAGWQPLDAGEQERIAAAVEHIREIHRPTGRIVFLGAPAPRRTWPVQPPPWGENEPETFVRARFELWLGAERERRRHDGRAPYEPADDQDLERLARWQVLRETPGEIAEAEVQSTQRSDRRHIVRDRARLIRRRMPQLAHALELPARPQSRVGRRPRRPAPNADRKR